MKLSAREDIKGWFVEVTLDFGGAPAPFIIPMSISEAEALRRELDASLMALEVESRR